MPAKGKTKEQKVLNKIVEINQKIHEMFVINKNADISTLVKEKKELQAILRKKK